jgi:hypothetical protein
MGTVPIGVTVGVEIVAWVEVEVGVEAIGV